MEPSAGDKKRVLLFSLLLVPLFFVAAARGACPDPCVCKWKGGKQTVECINKGLLSVPEGMDPETQVLDISGSTLQVLHRMLFQRLALLNLQRVYLSRCRLGHLDDHALQGLTNLVELDLSDNMLTSVPVATLTDVTALMRLSLARNPIQRLAGGSFRALRYLTTLELSNCEIEQIEDGAFDGLKSLEWLKLDGNKLRTVGGALVLPKSLHGITLHGNPWRCDCRLAQLRSWLVQYNVPTTLDPKCSSPERVSGRAVKSLDTHDFACAPEMSPSSMFLEIGLGKNVSFVCKVTGDPEPRVSWWRNGERLSLSSFNVSSDEEEPHFYYTAYGDSQVRYSELFISNTTEKENGTFVCAAENRAGSARSNFTLLVLLPPTEPPPTASTAEHAFTVGGVVAAIVTTLVIIIVAVAVRCCCCQRATRKTRDKDANVTATELTAGKDLPSKTSPTHSTLLSPHQLQSNSALAPSLVLNNSGTYSGALELESVDQSPDLINDTTVIKWKESSPDSSSYPIYDTVRTNVPIVRWTSDTTNLLPGAGGGGSHVKYYPAPGTLHTISELIPSSQYYSSPSTLPDQGLIALDPVRYLDPDGYPTDYGLPKPLATSQGRQQQQHVHFAEPATSIHHFDNYAMDEYLPAEQKYPDAYGHVPLSQGSNLVCYPSDRYPQEYAYLAAGTSRHHATPYEDVIPSPPEGYRNSVTPINAEDVALESGEGSAKSPIGREDGAAAPLPPLRVNVTTSSSPATSSRVPRNPHESPDEGYEDEGADGTEI